MKKCSLELRLSPVSPPSPLFCNSTTNRSTMNPQEIMIVYNGNSRVCDITEFQARAIIWMARQEMEERSNGSVPKPPLLGLGSPLRFSVKRSLQRFLQKRKKRSQAASPYNNNNNPSSPSS